MTEKRHEKEQEHQQTTPSQGPGSPQNDDQAATSERPAPAEAGMDEQASELERLKEQLAEKEEQLASQKEKLESMVDRLQHLQADFENYKKRVARERNEQAREIENRLLYDILPVYDGFERAFRAYNHNGDKEALIEGMERVFSQFNDFLQKREVRPIEALGHPFDPSLHEALLSVESEETPNSVIEVFERGYRRGGDVIRPSRVKVSRRPAQSRGHEVQSEANEMQGDREADPSDGPETP